MKIIIIDILLISLEARKKALSNFTLDPGSAANESFLLDAEIMALKDKKVLLEE